VKTYLVLEPAGGRRDAEGADAVRFVREKFYWTALLLAPFWLIRHRLWFALLAWLGAIALIGVAVLLLDLDPTSAAVALVLPSLVVGFDGSELRRRKLIRAGYRDAGAALGEDLEDAERRYFANWSTRRGWSSSDARVSPRTGLLPGAASVPAQPVIGLFPEPGGRR
jgi:hypothetical protein